MTDAPRSAQAAPFLALIPCAGTGSRFGSDTPKQYERILGRSILEWALESLLTHPLIRNVLIVTRPSDWTPLPLTAMAPDRICVRDVGGATRAESVLNGIQWLKQQHPNGDWVLVHDAARPCLASDDLDRLLKEGAKHPDGAILATPIRDTLKRDNGSSLIQETLPRTGLWAAQTPQLFRMERLLTALSALELRGITDEASAVEALGDRPLLIEGRLDNLKVTWPFDVQCCEATLKARGHTQIDSLLRLEDRFSS